MIEILVAVFILAVGLLGVAALQMGSLQSGQEGYFRTQATAIAEDLASRIRANRAFLKETPTVPRETAAVFAARYAGSPYACGAAPTMCRRNGATAATACSRVQLIAFERWEVCSAAANLLPGGEVRVFTNNGRATITVGWTAVQNNQAVGNRTLVNAACSANFGYAATQDCVSMEVIP